MSVRITVPDNLCSSFMDLRRYTDGMSPQQFVSLIEAEQSGKDQYLAHISNKDATWWKRGWVEVFGLLTGDGNIKTVVKQRAPGVYRELDGHAVYFPTENKHRKLGFIYTPDFDVLAIAERALQPEIDHIMLELEHRDYHPRWVWNGWATSWNGTGVWTQV